MQAVAAESRHPMESAGSSVRTCVGCAKRDRAQDMVALFVEGGRVTVRVPEAIAPSPRPLGKGAHVHPRAKCIANASKGLARLQKRSVRVAAEDVRQAIVAAASHEVAEAIHRAARLGVLAPDGEASEGGVVVVAFDAIRPREGIVVGTRAELGRLAGVSEADAFVVRHARLSRAIRAARALVDSVGGGFSLEDG